MRAREASPCRPPDDAEQQLNDKKDLKSAVIDESPEKKRSKVLYEI